MNAQQLVKYIKSHYMDSFVGDDGKIRAEAEYVDAIGNVVKVWEVVDPTLDAVRDWLGY